MATHANPPTTSSRGAVKSSLRTLEVLEALGQTQERRTITELAHELNIPKSSLHGLLHTMEARGWLSTDHTGTRFGLGLRALLAGNAFLEGDDIVTIAGKTLDHIGDRTAETVHLGRLDGHDIVYLAKRESRHPLRLYSAVGRRLPAHATALGKAVLATMTDDEVDRRLTWPLTPLTPRTITQPDALHAELNTIRATGYATDQGENTTGIHCIAIALPPTHDNHDAISCSVPGERMTPQHASTITNTLIDALHQLQPLIHRLAN